MDVPFFSNFILMLYGLYQINWQLSSDIWVVHRDSISYVTQGLIDEKVQEEEESRAKIAVSAAGRQQRHRQHKGDDAAKQGTDTKTVGPGGDGANISRGEGE